MLDFFAVITKGGLVLWYFQDVAQQLKTSIDAINALIRNVVLQVRKAFLLSILSLGRLTDEIETCSDNTSEFFATIDVIITLKGEVILLNVYKVGRYFRLAPNSPQQCYIPHHVDLLILSDSLPQFTCRKKTRLIKNSYIRSNLINSFGCPS